MRRLALLIPIVAWTAGCGDQPSAAVHSTPAPAPEAPQTAELTCANGWTFADRAPYRRAPRHRHTVTAGPMAVMWLRAHENTPARRFRARSDGGRRALHTKVLLEPRRTATLAVAPDDRERIALSTHMFNQDIAYPDGDVAIRFEGCPPRPGGGHRGTGYAFTLLVGEPGCVTLEITPEGGATMRRRVGFGAEGC